MIKVMCTQAMTTVSWRLPGLQPLWHIADYKMYHRPKLLRCVSNWPPPILIYTYSIKPKLFCVKITISTLPNPVVNLSSTYLMFAITFSSLTYFLHSASQIPHTFNFPLNPRTTHFQSILSSPPLLLTPSCWHGPALGLSLLSLLSLTGETVCFQAFESYNYLNVCVPRLHLLIS